VQSEPTTANRQIARAAGTVMIAFVLSNLTGLVRQILVSRAFGTHIEMDAFNAASNIPDLLFNLVAGGALASAFIPTFTGLLTKNDRDGAWKLASAIINIVALILLIISIIAMVFAPLIVRDVLYILKPDLDPSLQSLTSELLRILLISPVIFGVSGLLMGILNAHQKFWLPALAPTMYWLGMIFGVLFLAPSMGIYGLAWGAVIGSVLHLGIQLPGLPRLAGIRFRLSLSLDDYHVLEVARLMAPRLLGVGIVQLNFVINTIIASSLSEGSLTAIKVAWMVMTMPQVVIAQSIAIAALPTFSAQFARGETSEMRASLAATLRGVLLLSLPATFGLILLREPIVTMLFQRGKFDALSTQMTAWALLWYTAGLVGHSIVEILSRAFYALHDTKTPVVVGTVAMSLNVVFSFAFAWLFNQVGWMPHGGLALANSLATALEGITLFILMRRRLNGIEGKLVARGFTQAALGTLGMSLVLVLWMQFTGGLNPWLIGLGGIALGGVAYGVSTVILKVSEINTVINIVKRRLPVRVNGQS
jgi:putative peptidoglycan lipid II flippase